MMIKANRRSAPILIAGLLLCVAGPMRASKSDARSSDTTTEENAPDKPVVLSKFTKHHSSKKVVLAKSRKSAKQTKNDALKADPAKGGAKSADDTETASAAVVLPAISASVANANAQLPTDMQADTPATLAAKADTMLKGMGAPADETTAPPVGANMQLVSADQLNDVDRAISPDSLPPAAAITPADAPVIVNNNSTTLDQTSLIGKIFIAFGGLLTLASAARMFMA